MTDKPSPRRLVRELVLKALYASETAKDTQEESTTEIFLEIAGEYEISDKNLRFARDLFNLTLRHYQWADRQIIRLSRHWDIDRIAVVDRTIIRMAMVELEHMPDTPVKVALNEAIELARKFSTSESPAFVNGILDAFVKGMKNLSGTE